MMTTTKISVKHIAQRKKSGDKIAMLTCYDYTFAKLINETLIDIVLVGDSLGNVVLGYENTTRVKLSEVVHHVRGVARGVKRPLLCADMPFLTYTDPVQALRSAKRLVQAGAQCVKLEGGTEIVLQVEKLVQAGVPVMGHLGFTPQSIHRFGGHFVQGRAGSERLIAAAEALQVAGVFALVLEMIPASLAGEITSRLAIPVIGIGAGVGCDGQVLVLHDLLGCDASFNPKFLKKYENFAEKVHNAIGNYVGEVRAGSFPDDSQSYE